MDSNPRSPTIFLVSGLVRTCAAVDQTLFEPGITLQPRQVTLTAHPQGHCTGTLTAANGEQRWLTKEPMTMHVGGSGTHSCLGGSSEGTGHLDLAGEQIDFTWRLTQLTAETLAWIQGADGGSAFGPITPDLAPSNFALMLGCIQPPAQSVLSGRLDLVTTPALAGSLTSGPTFDSPELQPTPLGPCGGQSCTSASASRERSGRQSCQ